MPINDTLTPQEAARIATNSYFTLKNWIDKEPVAGVESRANIHNRVLGPANVGSKDHDLTSLQDTNHGLANSRLTDVHSATTGFGTSSGFGYTLTYEGKGKRHAIIATRGTRPELRGIGRWPDLLTDFRASCTLFEDYGPVHKGFKVTFDSIMPNLVRGSNAINSADVVHCVGHSLGGAVATLIASHYAARGNNVKLYTFGSPRVGLGDTYAAIENEIRPENIYRVAHDLDPITYIAPFPFIHVHPEPKDLNNLTLKSPLGELFGFANHDMGMYIESVGNLNWNVLRGEAASVDHDNSVLCRWLLHESRDTSWVTYGSVKALSLLFRMFSHVLGGLSTSIIMGLSAVDFLAEILMKGLYGLRTLGRKIYTLLKYAAMWAGIATEQDMNFTEQIIKNILSRMLTTLRQLSANALSAVTRNILPMRIAIGEGWILSSAAVI